jgi:hypothetical protein
MMETVRKNWAVIAIVAFVCAGVLASGIYGSAKDYNPPTGTSVEGTVTLPTPCTEENPCEPLPTPTEGVGFVTPVPVGDALVIEMPATGAGSTAREIKQSAHTGWHYSQWCDSGWILWYRYYAYASNHNKHYNESFGNLGRCWF